MELVTSYIAMLLFPIGLLCSPRCDASMLSRDSLAPVARGMPSFKVGLMKHTVPFG